jgi:hypothetical protein
LYNENPPSPASKLFDRKWIFSVSKQPFPDLAKPKVSLPSKIIREWTQAVSQLEKMADVGSKVENFHVPIKVTLVGFPLTPATA